MDNILADTTDIMYLNYKIKNSLAELKLESIKLSQ